MTGPRIPRADQTRQATNRPVFGGFKGRLDIDASLVPSHLKACWIRETVRGQRDDANVWTSVEDRGFTPATTDQFPSLSRRSIPGMPEPADNLVRRDGMILMVRPKEVHDEERAYLAATNAEKQRSVARISEAQMDGVNFRESADNKIVERVSRATGRFPE